MTNYNSKWLRNYCSDDHNHRSYLNQFQQSIIIGIKINKITLYDVNLKIRNKRLGNECTMYMHQLLVSKIVGLHYLMTFNWHAWCTKKGNHKPNNMNNKNERDKERPHDNYGHRNDVQRHKHHFLDSTLVWNHLDKPYRITTTNGLEVTIHC
jgi:hypothetical protein